MSKDKYVAYVGTYTHGSSIGIHVYDLDVENGYMTEREVVPEITHLMWQNPTMENICIRLQMKVLKS